MFVALTMNVSILSLRRHSDPGEIFQATIRIKVQLVANAVSTILVIFVAHFLYVTLLLKAGVVHGLYK